jgi:hypothetical protein
VCYLQFKPVFIGEFVNAILKFAKTFSFKDMLLGISFDRTNSKWVSCPRADGAERRSGLSEV